MAQNLPDLETFHPLEIKALRAMGRSSEPSLSLDRVAEEGGLDDGQCRRALELLKTRELVEVAREIVCESVELTEMGLALARSGIPEVVILRTSDQEGGLTPAELREVEGLDPALVGPTIGTLKKLGLAEIYEGGLVAPAEGALPRSDEIEALVRRLQSAPLPMEELDSFALTFVKERSRRRGKGNSLFSLRSRTDRYYALTALGREASTRVEALGLTGEEITTLTAEMIRTESWRGKGFRKFNLSLAPPRVQVGRKHPYRLFIDGLKSRLCSLGFEEMRGSLTESEFWNMDALYMPQFHSAREIHDVYRVKTPPAQPRAEEPFLSQVSAAHADGGKTGSKGWRYDFDVERSRRHVFRSHGTVLSARTLASGPKIPGKYFAVARCFRPDKVDATHAPDFFQVEGIVLGEDITFRTLLGLLELFAREIAMADEVKYTPAYFPFTEPSVEAHIKHPVLGWTELGGAGIFRPEVTLPLGVSVPVIAWGLGLDRMALMALGLNDIRELFTRDLNLLRESRIPL